MVAEFICGPGSQIIAILEFFSFIGITIGAVYISKGIKTIKNLFKLKSSWVVGGIYLLTLGFLGFDAFGCPFF